MGEENIELISYRLTQVEDGQKRTERKIDELPALLSSQMAAHAMGCRQKDRIDALEKTIVAEVRKPWELPGIKEIFTFVLGLGIMIGGAFYGYTKANEPPEPVKPSVSSVK